MTRKIIVIGCLLSIASWAGAVTKNRSFQEYDFSKGLDSYHNASTLQPGYVQDAVNVLFDSKYPVTKRFGYTVAWTTKTYSFNSLWSYTDQTNTTWQLARSSDEIIANNLAGMNVLVATVSANSVVGETNAFGNAYFVDQTQGVYYWNGTSTTYISGTPKGSIITQFHNRLWVTGLAAPAGNQLYGSGYYSGSNWTSGLNPSDPVQYSIGLQDNFDNVTAEYVYLDTLYLFKHYSIFALYGFDQTSFQISQLTQECGCIDGGSIQTYNGGLKFVSLRGVEDFNGYTCKRISDNIKDKVDPAINSGGFSQQSWVQQQQSDWQAGTFNASNSLDAVDAVPTLILTHGSYTDNNCTNFNLGTYTRTACSGGVVGLDTVNTSVTNNGFETGSLTSGWNHGGGGVIGTSFAADHCSLVPRTGTYYLKFGDFGVNPSYTVVLNRCSDNSTLSSNTFGFSSNACSYITRTLSSSGLKNQCVYIYITDSHGASVVDSDDFYNSGTDITFYTASDTFGGENYVAFDDFTDGNNSITIPGIYTSESIDTTLTNPDVLTNFLWTQASDNNGHGPVPAVSIQGSSDNVHFYDVTHTTGTNNAMNRYLREISTFTATGNQSVNQTLTSTNFTYTASSGVFTSPPHAMTGINSFGNFSTQETDNGGSIVYALCTSSSSTMYPEKCASQTANAQISIATNTYVEVIATFSVTAATQAPTLQSATVGWFVGNHLPQMTSTVWDNRYWLSLTTNTADAINDAILVLDSAGAWSVFDIHAGGLTQYKNSLYHSDSNATGNIYLDNQGDADNGSAINAYIRTRTMGLGDFASDDYLYALYPSAANTGSCSMTVAYKLDKSTTSYSLGSPALNEYATISSVRLPFPIDSSHQVFGESIDFTIGTDDSSCDWDFYGLEGLYKMRPVQ